MRIFLDANILFSAAKSAGALRALLRRARAAGHRLCADAYVVAEARRSLSIKEGAAIEALEELLRVLEMCPYTSAAFPPEVKVPLPEQDQPVLAAAVTWAVMPS